MSPALTNPFPPPPPTLYRYFGKPPGLGRDENYLLKMLRGESIRFADPMKFNDPFECTYLVNYVGTEDEIFRRFLPVAIAADPKGSADEWIRRARDTASRAARGFSTAELQQARASMSQFGVMCLTKKHDNLLMWSHYASAHEGVCFGFDTSVGVFRFTFPVTYADDLPAIDFLASAPPAGWEHFSTAILHKASCWAYEDEWRTVCGIVTAEGRGQLRKISAGDALREYAEIYTGPGDFPFDRGAIKEVIFGARCHPDLKAAVCDEIAQLGLSVKLFSAAVSPRKYELNIDLMPL